MVKFDSVMPASRELDELAGRLVIDLRFYDKHWWAEHRTTWTHVHVKDNLANPIPDVAFHHDGLPCFSTHVDAAKVIFSWMTTNQRRRLPKFRLILQTFTDQPIREATWEYAVQAFGPEHVGHAVCLAAIHVME